jgi:hypothetical protein
MVEALIGYNFLIANCIQNLMFPQNEHLDLGQKQTTLSIFACHKAKIQ